MPPKSNKKSQVSFSLNEQEKTILTKQSFRQNRSVSQIMRFAIKKYLDGLNSLIKNQEDCIKNPPSNLVIISDSFSKVLKHYFKSKIKSLNVFTEREIFRDD